MAIHTGNKQSKRVIFYHPLTKELPKVHYSVGLGPGKKFCFSQMFSDDAGFC